jgi:hypothetical protein
MAYKQQQGRSEFSKTGRGITSKLAGPENPPKDITTNEGVSARIKNIAKGVQTGKATIGRAMSALYNLQGASTGDKIDYRRYQKDSTNIANTETNLISGGTYNYGKMVRGLSGKDAIKKLKKYNDQ